MSDERGEYPEASELLDEDIEAENIKTVEPKPDDFRFLGIDGHTHLLPAYDDELFVPLSGQGLVELKPMSEVARMTPKEQQEYRDSTVADAILARQQDQIRSWMLTIDAHNPDDGYKDGVDAINALVNNNEWALFGKLVGLWMSGKQGDDSEGEDSASSSS